MRINSSVVAILGWLLLGTAIAAAAEAPKGFRNLTWGASPNKQLKEAPASPGGGISLYQPRPGKPLPSLFNVPIAEEAYSFAKGRFFSASAWTDGKENFEKMKAALIKTYGQATLTDGRKNFTIWKWPDSPVEVRLAYNEKFSRATVTYVNTALNASDLTDAATASSAVK